MLKPLLRIVWLFALAFAPLSASGAEKSLDLRRAVPASAFMAVHHRYNPERDFQREYMREVWETARDTRLLERLMEIVSAQAKEEDLEKAKGVWQRVKEALGPCDPEEILNCSECVYGQTMTFPAAHHILAMRLTPEAASAGEEAMNNLFDLLIEFSENKLTKETSVQDSVQITTLALPKEVPFRPAVAHIGDVLVLGSSDEFVRESIRLMHGSDEPSKFDDPRLLEALKQLPEPEDDLVFYDGQLQFQQIREIPDFIRSQVQGQGKEKPEVERVAGIIELVLDEMAILDYEITVGYTEGYQNRTESLGRLMPGAETKMLAKLFTQGEPFDDWSSWVPANAHAYSLTTGANLHVLYQWIMDFLDEHVPEAEKPLAQFEQMQQQWGVNIDGDILQSFSGETVSVTMPTGVISLFGGQASVTAMRCHNPDRIRELLHRLVEQLQTVPALAAQKLELKECEELEGFEELSATALDFLGATPAIGFRDGWMMIGSTAKAVQNVLDTRAGVNESMAQSPEFEKFGLQIDGPVSSISYTNIRESVRAASTMMTQAGVVGPMVFGAVGADADEEWVKQVQKLLGLLPSVARIVAKFDFLESRVMVAQAGKDPGAYTKQSVILVRPPVQDEAPTVEVPDPESSEKAVKQP